VQLAPNIPSESEAQERKKERSNSEWNEKKSKFKPQPLITVTRKRANDTCKHNMMISVKDTKAHQLRHLNEFTLTSRLKISCDHSSKISGST